MSHPRVLAREHSLLVVIDVQEAYRSIAFEFERVCRSVARLIDAAALLDVPVIATVQYPKGLGDMVPELRGRLPPPSEPVEKLSLSCCGTERFNQALATAARRQVIVCGLEAHACVNQTVHDLLADGYQVHVPRDAISSRFESDYEIGWDKMTGSGAVPATVEMVCLEWVRTAAVPEFKAIQKLIR
jgi:nicotinamidase-related amidase